MSESNDVTKDMSSFGFLGLTDVQGTWAIGWLPGSGVETE